MLRTVCLILCAMFAGGCSDGPEMHPVSGTVTLDGKPVEGASVVFNPVAADGALAAGKTNAQGGYELRTNQTEGARAGQYKVTVSLTQTIGEKKETGSDDKRKMTYLVPKKFSDPETSGLEEDVPGKQAYDIKLTSR